jgi:hypothetical protein
VEPPLEEPEDDGDGDVLGDDAAGVEVVVVDEVELPPEDSPEPAALPEPLPARESVR